MRQHEAPRACFTSQCARLARREVTREREELGDDGVDLLVADLLVAAWCTATAAVSSTSDAPTSCTAIIDVTLSSSRISELGTIVMGTGTVAPGSQSPDRHDGTERQRFVTFVPGLQAPIGAS